MWLCGLGLSARVHKVASTSSLHLSGVLTHYFLPSRASYTAKHHKIIREPPDVIASLLA